VSKEIKNLHRRRKRLGLSLLRYFHAFMAGYGDKRTSKDCPYETESLSKAYWEGRKTRMNYDGLTGCGFIAKKTLTPYRD